MFNRDINNYYCNVSNAKATKTRNYYIKLRFSKGGNVSTPYKVPNLTNTDSSQTVYNKNRTIPKTIKIMGFKS